MVAELGRSAVVVRTEARKTSADGNDTSGFGGAGTVKVKLPAGAGSVCVEGARGGGGGRRV